MGVGNCPHTLMKQKEIVLKSRSKQRGRSRKRQISSKQYASNWDRIFKKDK